MTDATDGQHRADEEQPVEQAESAAGEVPLLPLHAHHVNSGCRAIDTGGVVAEPRFARRGWVDRSKASNQLALALLVHMLAKEADLEPGEAIWYGMDVHMYLNHIDQAKKQLSRTPRPWPTLRIKRKAPSLFDYTIDDFELEGYDPHPPIRLPIAV